MRARMCSLMMLDESREWLDLRASYGAGEAYLNKPRLSVEESCSASWCAAKSRCRWRTSRPPAVIRTSKSRGAKDWFRC